MANENVEALRQKYMKDVPIGFTAEEIQRMSDDDILDMLVSLGEVIPIIDSNGAIYTDSQNRIFLL